jgi:hypothetical protein
MSTNLWTFGPFVPYEGLTFVLLKFMSIIYTPPCSAIGIPDFKAFLVRTDTAGTCRSNMAQRGIHRSTNTLKFGEIKRIVRCRARIGSVDRGIDNFDLNFNFTFLEEKLGILTCIRCV